MAGEPAEVICSGFRFREKQPCVFGGRPTGGRPGSTESVRRQGAGRWEVVSSAAPLQEESVGRRQVEEEQQRRVALHSESGLRRSLSSLPDSWRGHLSGEELVLRLRGEARIRGRVVWDFWG